MGQPSVGLSTLVDVAAFQSLMDDFYRLAGVPMAILDMEGRVLVGVGWQDVCTTFHRVHPEACRHCIESDTELSAGVPSGEFKLYKCKNNMWDVATPIVVGDRHVGNVFCGQFFFDDESVDYARFRAQARIYGFDERKYIDALDHVPRLSREAINTAMAFLVKLAQMLSNQGEAYARLSEAVEERDALNRSLRDSEADLARAQEVAHIGSWRMDVRRDALMWSREVYRIFGIAPGTPQTYESFLAAVHPDDRETVNRAWNEALARRQPYGVEHRVVVGDAITWVREAAELEFDETGSLLGGFGTVQDVTERKRVEDALRDANTRLTEGGQRKDEFIAVLSHELRNPLAPIRYAVPVLQRQNLDEDGRHAAAVVSRQADHLTRLVDDLLDVARITQGKIELCREFVTLASVLAAAIEAASPAIVREGHRLTLAIADGDTIGLYADPMRLTQVITNLLDNSARYTPPGGEIRLEARRVDGHAIVCVRDNGIGIPPEALATVFEMFRQVDRPDRPQGGGLGVGLALVKRLVEMHDGVVEARSAGLGHGTEFLIRLPIAPRGAGEGVQRMGPLPTPRQALKVLAVDDNEDFVEMLAALVRDAGHEVRTALDGHTALAVALSFRPDVVLLDLGLPIMSGIEVARELRQHADTRNAHLVALTGWGTDDDRRQTSEAGFDLHLTKPTDPNTLEQLLAEVAIGGRGRN